MAKTGSYPAVFLDRDGTLNIDKGYVHLWADWEWLPGAKEALAFLKEAGYKLVVVTNQAGVAKGLYSEEAVRELGRLPGRLLLLPPPCRGGRGSPGPLRDRGPGRRRPAHC